MAETGRQPIHRYKARHTTVCGDPGNAGRDTTHDDEAVTCIACRRFLDAQALESWEQDVAADIAFEESLRQRMERDQETPGRPTPQSHLDGALAAGRASFLGFPDHDALSQACTFVEQALDETCYLVGSVLEHREYRDVDVRVIMDDDKYDAFLGEERGLNPFWSLLCVSISEYLGRRTGLKVDFQIQKRSRVREEDWVKRREPLGIFVEHPTRRPSWISPEPAETDAGGSA